MEFEDFLEPEIAVTAAVVAAIASPRARSTIRKGLVYGMAGVLSASEAITSFAQNVRHGVWQAGQAATHEVQDMVGQAKEMEKGTKTRSESEATTPQQ
ncbi:MAG TPA: hypothetical protein VKV19_17335 [Ktedonobacteraceae bacterium]|nr:hypothetical protein [Ktedonobacteraceae bacterium]